MARRSFFEPIQTTFQRAKGPVMSDRDLLAAWAHVPTDRLKAICRARTENGARVESETQRIRLRVLELRRAAEDPDRFNG